MTTSYFVPACLLLIASLVSVPVAHGAEPDIEERLTKLVIRDPLRPNDAVLVRLEKVEEQLEKSAQADKDAERQETKDQRDLDRMLEAMQKDLKNLGTRVEAVEKGSKQSAGGDADLRKVQRELSTLQRTLDDLKQRVTRLEQTR